MTTVYVATDRQGRACLPHRYPDGLYRAVRYVPGDPRWKAKENYVLVPERDLPAVMADPDLYVRMSPAADPRRPALFPTRAVAASVR
ncbi:hypothetical protein [Salinarimonas rosea]|uniref:hypothetical protein n=1 Tax=Salinarimonas rosea TaxID=552063 RepID=UPI000405A64C|nr:hypothetical protein [Salinarimonas rosea]